MPADIQGHPGIMKISTILLSWEYEIKKLQKFGLETGNDDGIPDKDAFV